MIHERRPLEIAIKIASVDHELWKSAFLKDLQEGAANDTTAARRWATCPLDTWLEGLGPDNRLSPPFQRVEELHAEMHIRADCMMSAPFLDDISWLEQFAEASRRLKTALDAWKNTLSPADEVLVDHDSLHILR